MGAGVGVVVGVWGGVGERTTMGTGVEVQPANTIAETIAKIGIMLLLPQDCE